MGDVESPGSASFLERVRMLAQKGLKATGGPMGDAGEIFDLLDAVCDAFDPELRPALGLAGIRRGGKSRR